MHFLAAKRIVGGRCVRSMHQLCTHPRPQGLAGARVAASKEKGSGDENALHLMSLALTDMFSDLA